jgi:hypothetical protein
MATGSRILVTRQPLGQRHLFELPAVALRLVQFRAWFGFERVAVNANGKGRSVFQKHLEFVR